MTDVPDPAALRILVDIVRDRGGVRLGQREATVLYLRVARLSSAERISDVLGVRKKTVESYFARIRDMLDVHSPHAWEEMVAEYWWRAAKDGIEWPAGPLEVRS